VFNDDCSVCCPAYNCFSEANLRLDNTFPHFGTDRINPSLIGEYTSHRCGEPVVAANEAEIGQLAVIEVKVAEKAVDALEGAPWRPRFRRALQHLKPGASLICNSRHECL
jgi:hypothetical protein